MLCDHIEVWNRKGDAKGSRYRDICICMADSLCYKAETNLKKIMSVVFPPFSFCILFICLFIHSSVDGHLGCFHVLAIVNSATINTGVHVSFF